MTKQEYLQKIKDNFPKLKFKKAELITSGYDDDVIILDKKIVFSFPKQKLDCPKKFQKELKFLPFLNKQITLQIPDFIYIPKDKTFAGYKYIKGVPLVNKIFKQLKPKEKQMCADQIAVFLNELHSFPIQTARRNSVDKSWTEKDARGYYLKQTKTVLGKLSLVDQRKLGKVLETLKTKYKRIKPAVVHQDFTDDHILFDAKTKNIVGIIDFGDVQISDPAIDLSKMWYYGEEFLDMILKKYKTADKDIKERSRRWWVYHNVGLMYLGIAKKRNDYWESGHRRLMSL